MDALGDLSGVVALGPRHRLYSGGVILLLLAKNLGKKCIPIHTYRLVYPDSPHAPERLWEWDKVHVGRLLWNATVFGRELTHQYFPTWDALRQENQRIWDVYYLPRPAYEPWETWRAWLDEYRELVRDVQEIYTEHSGRRRIDPLQARQTMEHG